MRLVNTATLALYLGAPTHGEWFRLEGLLLEHIERLQVKE